MSTLFPLQTNFLPSEPVKCNWLPTVLGIYLPNLAIEIVSFIGQKLFRYFPSETIFLPLKNFWNFFLRCPVRCLFFITDIFSVA